MAAVNRRVVNSLNEGRRTALTSYRHRRSIATAICTLALAANVGLSPLASAAEGSSLITPAEKISIAEVRQSMAEQLVARIQRSTETDASITIDEDALVKLLEAHGNVRLPVASQSTVALRPQMAQESAVDVAAMAVNDAVITYNRPLASNARATLTVCRAWGPLPSSGCATSGGNGVLAHNENTRTKFGWADADGYYHPSNTCTTHSPQAGGSSSAERAESPRGKSRCGAECSPS